MKDCLSVFGCKGLNYGSPHASLLKKKKDLFNLAPKITQMEGAKAGLITVCLFVCLSEILTALATRSKAIPNTVKEKNGLCSPRCDWCTEGHRMGQKWALSLEYFVARIARPLTFNTFYFLRLGRFCFC